MTDLNSNHSLEQSHPSYSNTNLNQRQTLVCESFQKDMLKNLLNFRNENLFTDICIYVEGVEFKCHKVILCAASTYFKAMFSCDLKESRLGKVYIENITPWTMKRLIDFIYTSKIDINDDNVIDVFNGACMFNLYNLIEKCSVYIEENIDLNNCIDLYLFSDIHNLDKLKKSSFNFILDNFVYIYEQTSDYVKLNESTFQLILKSELLNIPKEIYIFNALIKWINFMPEQRLKLFDSFIKLIRFNALSQEELSFILNEKLIKDNNEIFKYVQRFFSESVSPNAKLRPSTMPRDYLCVLNPFEFKVYDFLKSKYDSLDCWPIKSDITDELICLKGFSICVVNNYLYIFGGLKNDEITNNVWKFDSTNCKWSKCCSMLNKHAFHISVSIMCSNLINHNYILILYGVTLSSNDATQYTQCTFIEYYDILNDSWSLLNLNNSSTNSYNLMQFYNPSDSYRFLIEQDVFLMKKSIVSLKNIIYVLQENCIHCYQFRSQLSQLIALPYFRLPENLNNLIIINAVAVPTQTATSTSSSSSSSSSSIFSWKRDTIDDTLNNEKQNDCDTTYIEKYEALIFLLDSQQMVLYEFFPAKNKLKKLPKLNLTHSINETKILYINSKIYITGGYLNDSNSDNMAIEEFDEESNCWSTFLKYDSSRVLNNRETLTLNDDLNVSLSLNNCFFKLKMSVS